MQKQIFILSLLCLLCGCSADKEADTQPSEVEPSAVSFDVSQVETRAGYQGELSLDILKSSTSFGVYGYYTGTRSDWANDITSALIDADKVWPNFMYNQLVSWDADNSLWYYAPVKFWPNGTGQTDDTRWTGENNEYVSFFAYAPHDDLNVDTENLSTLKNDPTTDPSYGIKAINGTSLQLTTLTSPAFYAPTIDYTMNGNGKKIDLLWATPQLNHTKPSVNAKIPFTFHHALSAVRVLVQRVYDDDLPGDQVLSPDDQVDTRIFLTNLSLRPKSGSTWYISGTLNIGDGHWTNAESDRGTDLQAATAMAYSATDIHVRLSGADVDLLTDDSELALTNVRNNELNKWNNKYDENGLRDDTDGELAGVIATPRIVNKGGTPFFFLPQSLTLTPHVSYSYVTRDNGLELNYLTDKDDNRYQRIFHKDMAGNDLTIHFEAGKKYTLLCLIGVESVRFQVIEVEDWDFPLRFTTKVGSDTQVGKEKTLNEE